MTDNSIIYPETLFYLNEQNQFNDPKLLELETIAKSENQPIVQREAAIFLMMLCRIQRPKRILELGCNIGFSACCMSTALDHQVQIDTIEFKADNVERARKNLSNNVSIHHRSALDYLDSLSASDYFDFVFIDANKKENQNYVEKLEAHLSKNALICVDNVLWKGRTSSRSLIEEHAMDSTQAIRHFNQWMSQHQSFHSQILAIGDGLLLAQYAK